MTPSRALLRAGMCAAAAVFVQVIVAAALSAQSPDSLVLRSEPAGGARLFVGGLTHTATAPVRWRERDWRRAGTALIAVAALSSLDESGRDFMRARQSETFDRATTELERFGTVENYYALAAFMVGGVVFDDAKARDVAIEGIVSSALAAGVITPTLQKISGRSRPRKDRPAHTFDLFSGNISFPSGHTTHAFAVASVIATEYDHAVVQAAAYGVATGVAVSRMYHGAHFVSDVALAAAIGTLVGRNVAHYGQRRRQAFQVVPTAHDGAFGVAVSLSR